MSDELLKAGRRVNIDYAVATIAEISRHMRALGMAAPADRLHEACAIIQENVKELAK